MKCEPQNWPWRLQGEGIVFDAAYTLEETKYLWQEKKPDMILLDVNFPDGDGFSFLRTLRHSFKYFYIAFKIPQIVQILYYSGYYPPNPAISAVWRSLSHACLISPACWYVIFSGFDLTIRFLSSDKSALSDERMLLSSFFPELW